MMGYKKKISIFLILLLFFTSIYQLGFITHIKMVNYLKVNNVFASSSSFKNAYIDGDKIVFRYKGKIPGGKTNYSVKVKIDGKSYNMNYDRSTKFYIYVLNNPRPKTYTYSFVEIINKITREIPAASNKVKTKYTIAYKGLDIKVDASVYPETINSDQNAVLSISLSGLNAKNNFCKDIYMDLSEVGGPGSVRIDKELMKQTIGVTDSTPVGKKEIKVTLVDTTGNKHIGKTTININNKQSKGALDFSFDEARIYFLLTDRFFNGDVSNDDPHHQNYDRKQPMTYHGGDFKGITSKLNYLKELGINTIWITPIVENTDFNQIINGGAQYSYHGYWAKDFTKLDPHLGTMEDFKELLDKAHENGIKIMVDVVLNHAGYGMKNADSGYKNVSNYPTDENRKAFAGMFRSSSGADDWTKELSGLPDFKTEDANVRNKIISWQISWINNSKTSKGNTIDYFRVDTVKNVDDTTFKAFKNALTLINPSFKLIGEYFNGSINNDGDQLRTGQMDALLDFSYKSYADHFVNGKLVSIEKLLEERDEKINNTATMGQFLGSHDEDGFLTRQAINGDLNKLKLAATLQITDKGIPVIYYGEELGASAFNGYPKDANRYDMPWSNLENDKYRSIHDHYQKLLNIRKDYSLIFAKGNRKTLSVSNEDKYLVFSRNYNNQTVIIAANIESSDKQVKVKVPYNKGTKIKDAFNDINYIVDDNQSINMKIPKMADGGTAILVVSEK